MKTNNMNINSMKNYSKYICLFLMLVGMSVNAWGLTINLNTSTNVFSLRTSSGNDASSEISKTVNGYTYKIYAANSCYYYSSKAFFIGQSGSYITFPAISDKKLTSVTIWNCSGAATPSISICPTNSTTEVTGGDAADVSPKSSTTWTISGTAANTSYRAYITNAKNLQMTGLRLVYENTSAYTVTFNAEKGTSAEPSLTEGSANAGVTLPDVNVDDDIEAIGWEFAGWATSTCSETEVAPRLYLAGEKYYPEGNETLYAVYRKLTDGSSTSTATFTASTQSGLTNIGTHPKIDYWWLHTASGVEFYIQNYGIYSSAFNLDDSEGDGDGWAFLDAHRKIKQVVFTASSESYLIDEIEAYDDGDVEVTTSGTTQTVVCSGNVTQLLLDAPENGESYITTFTVTYYNTRFNSNPCANVVSLSAGTETHATISSFSSSGVETCGTGEDDRKVTVSVTAATGYELTSSARLTFTKSSGTATATYVSGPTGSGPNYTFVYQFTKDDKGAGTFSVTATAKQSTITFDKNDGEGGPDGTTATYDLAMTTITPPTRTGYTFDGYWDAETDNNGSGNQYYKADGTSKKNWDKNTTSATTLYAKWNINSYTLAIASVDHVTISSTSPSVAAGSNTSVNYGTTVTLSHGTPSDGRTWSGWNAYKTGDTGTPVAVNGSNQFTMPAYDVTVSANLYGDFVFSCAELTLTSHLVTASTPIFITSAASKTVRSQDYIEISGNGLTPNTALTFPGLPSKFAIKKADGTAVSTDENGEISANAYIFYTPDAGDTSDGLDKLTGITVSVGGAKPKTATLTQDIIGRHLPADFVIAAKKDGKWWAMPSNMSSTTNPTPVEISVDNATNPSIAYTLSNTYYGLAGPTAANISGGNGQYIRFAMSIDDGTLDPHAAPLFGNAGNTTLGKSNNSQISSDLSAGNWWKLVQTNTSITNPQDAKYTIYCANNTQSLTLEDGGKWGLYATNGTDVDELRLVPARSGVSYEEAEIVEWGQHGAIVEVDTHLGYHTKVKAKLNGAETGFITLSQTKTSVSKVDTKYNYTVNFGDGIDFAAAASNGAMLTLEWYNTSEVLQSVSNIIVPKIIASSATMSSIESGDTPWSKWEVHVLPGVTLDANAGSFSSSDVVINNLQLYPGAILKVTTGTLVVTNLSLRNGWRRVGVAEPVYAAPRIQIKTTANLRHTNAYLDWYIDNDQFYPVAVPFPVKVSTITYLNTNNSVTVGGTSGVIRLRYFDGENRAAGNSGNWKYYGAVGCTAVPDTLKPSMGYALAAMRPGGKAFSILRMPLIYTDEWTALGEQASVVIETKTYRKDTVHVYAYGTGQTAEWNKGWNLIGNPYMSVFNGNDDGISGKLLYVTNVDDPKKDKVRYVTIPNSSFTDYSQVNITEANIRPFSSFLIQAKDTSAISFSKSKIEIPSAPAHYTATPASLPEQEVYIRLSNEEASDQMGLIIGEDYTAEYETDADLAKMHGELNTLKTYMVYDNVDMAYVAINEQLAQEWIPVTVRIPESGQYTFSMRSISVVDELEGVYLIDYSNGQVTNLIENDYSFITSSGTISGRFAINAIMGERQTPTDIDIIQGGGDINSEQPFKFLYHDKVFIYHRGVIYDATGKKVREINK